MGRGAGIGIATVVLTLALAIPAVAEARRAEGPVAETWFSGTASVVADKFEAARAEATYRLRGSATPTTRSASSSGLAGPCPATP